MSDNFEVNTPGRQILRLEGKVEELKRTIYSRNVEIADLQEVLDDSRDEYRKMISKLKAEIAALKAERATHEIWRRQAVHLVGQLAAISDEMSRAIGKS